jgi:hypothetical protein
LPQPQGAHKLALKRVSQLGALLWLLVAYPALYTLQARVQGVAIVVLVAVLFALWRLRGVAESIRRLLLAPRTAVFLPVICAANALLSSLTAYAVARTQPFSIDGMVYLFQARALGHGSFGAPMEFPRQFFSQRFLFQGADGLLHGVFPPGWPLFIAPWLRAGVPMLAGPAVAVLLTLASYTLAKTLSSLEPHGASLDTHSELTSEAPSTTAEQTPSDPSRDLAHDGSEWTARVAVMLALPSFARAVETADLLSHAFVAALGAGALSLVLKRLDERSQSPTRVAMLRALAAGLAIGWAFSARLLDGLILGLLCAAGLVWTHWRARRSVVTALALLLLGTLPGVALTAAAQKQATGSWTTPTQAEYFRRSDYPATCHRLGLGPDVGCYVEHGDERAITGAQGYTLSRAFQVTRSRAATLCDDLFSPGFLLIISFVIAALRPRISTAIALGCTVAFTFAYALFYYGNAPLFGARHVFVCAPWIYYVVAAVIAPAVEARRTWSAERATALATAIMLALAAGHAMRWRSLKYFWTYTTDNELGVRAAIARAEYPSGIIATPSINHAIAAYDPWTDHGVRVVVADNSAGLLDLRRAHADWAIFLSRPDATLVPTRLFELPANLSIECESFWPSLQFPSGLQSARALSLDYNRTIRTSGNQVLALTHARPGASVHLNFDAVDEGVFVFEMSFVTLKNAGNYRVSLDRQELFVLRGYGPTVENRTVESSTPRVMTLGAHSLLIECVGKEPDSTGYDAALDLLQARRPN